MSRAFATVPGPIPGGPGGLYGGTVPIENGAPPSTYAVASVIKGERGSLARLVGVTALRSIFIIPGLWGVARLMPGLPSMTWWQTTLLGLGASTTISLGLLVFYWMKEKTFGLEVPYG